MGSGPSDCLAELRVTEHEAVIVCRACIGLRSLLSRAAYITSDSLSKCVESPDPTNSDCKTLPLAEVAH